MKSAEPLRYEVQGRRFASYPLQWNELFSRSAPLALEIGCGNGEFLCDWAEAQPLWNFVGIEISLESAERIQQNIHRRRLNNVRVIRDDAAFVVRELFPEESLQQIMMNFPDPWPKTKHRSRRLMRPVFIRTLSAAISRGGIYELITDQEWYARDAARLFRESAVFQVEPIEQNPQRPVTTKYERKWRKAGRSIFRLRAIKQEILP
ncbi:MAG: tRNA (guanosine(46)-N7)-methyltransferase TrmB, partial [Calditrichia bacterium]